MGRLTGVLGIAVIIGLAYLFSTDRRAIKLKTIAWGLGLQLALGLFGYQVSLASPLEMSSSRASRARVIPGAA